MKSWWSPKVCGCGLFYFILFYCFPTCTFTFILWNLCRISKWSTKKNLDLKNRTSFDSIMVIINARLLIFQLNTQVLPIVFTTECRIVNKIGDVLQSHLNICLYGVCSLSLTTHQSNIIMGASIVKWTKKVLWYTKAMIFLVKHL